MYDFSLGSLSRSFRDKPCRAVIYGRASTEHEAQVKALENQMQWYDDVARYHPQWNIIKRYIDATDIIGLKQNPTNGRRFSPIFVLSGHFPA